MSRGKNTHTNQNTLNDKLREAILQREKVEEVKALIEAGADPHTTGYTALDYALLSLTLSKELSDNTKQTIEYLISKEVKVKPNTWTKTMLSPAEKEAFNLIIDHNLGRPNPQSPDEYNALDYLTDIDFSSPHTANTPRLETILNEMSPEHKTKILEKYLNKLIKNTPSYILGNTNDNDIENLLAKIKLLAFHTEQELTKNSTDALKLTCLILSNKKYPNTLEFINFLTHRGVVEIEDIIEDLLSRSNLDSVKFLVEKGVKIPPALAEKILDLAIEEKNVEVAKTLAQSGIHISSNSLKTAENLATRYYFSYLTITDTLITERNKLKEFEKVVQTKIREAGVTIVRTKGEDITPSMLADSLYKSAIEDTFKDNITEEKKLPPVLAEKLVEIVEEQVEKAKTRYTSRIMQHALIPLYDFLANLTKRFAEITITENQEEKFKESQEKLSGTHLDNNVKNQLDEIKASLKGRILSQHDTINTETSSFVDRAAKSQNRGARGSV